MFVVSISRYRTYQERSAQTQAVEASPSSLSPKIRRTVDRGEKYLAHLWKEIVVHDEDGNATGKRRERACEITVIRLDYPVDLRDVGSDAARACGFRTVEAFRDSWTMSHPRSPQVAIAWFALGNWMDPDTYLAYGGRRAGANDRGYTQSRAMSLDPEAPVPPEVAAAFAFSNRQSDDARRARASQALAAESPALRLLRLERYIEHLRLTVGEEAAAYARREIRQEERIIRQRLDRAERRAS